MILKWWQVSWVIKYAAPDKKNLSRRYKKLLPLSIILFFHVHLFYAFVNMFWKCFPASQSEIQLEIRSPAVEASLHGFEFLSISWLWRWLWLRMLKGQSLTTVLPRTPFTWTIKFHQGNKRNRAAVSLLFWFFNQAFLVHAFSKWDVGRKYGQQVVTWLVGPIFVLADKCQPSWKAR